MKTTNDGLRLYVLDNNNMISDLGLKETRLLLLLLVPLLKI